MNETAIAWTDVTWNVVSGCKKITPACAHCYAHELAERHRGDKAFPYGFDLTVRPHKLGEPRKLLRSKVANGGPALVFVESMSDIGLDDDELTNEERARLRAAGFENMDRLRDAMFGVMRTTRRHRYQLVTKRPRVLLRYLEGLGERLPPNVWIIVTVENAREARERLPVLREIRDRFFRLTNVAGVSIEPLLDAHLADEPAMREAATWLDWMIIGGESGVHFSDPKHAARFCVTRTSSGYEPVPAARIVVRALLGLKRGPDVLARADDAIRAAGFLGLAGGCSEEGTSVRLIHASLLSHVQGTMRARAAAEALRLTEACYVPTFFKQWGGPRPDSGGREVDGRTYDEMPTVPGALPVRRLAIDVPTTALARKGSKKKGAST